MNADEIEPILNDQPDRLEWVQPSLKRLNAGSAENDAGPSTDLAVNS